MEKMFNIIKKGDVEKMKIDFEKLANQFSELKFSTY
jgi:hypothetical protein